MRMRRDQGLVILFFAVWAGPVQGARDSAILSSGSGAAITAPAAVEANTNERNGLWLATVDVTAVPSMDALGSPNNVVMFVWVGPSNQVIGMGWDVVVQTVAFGSWRTDMTLLITNTAVSSGVAFRPAPGAGPGGPAQYGSGDQIVTFQSQGLSNVHALADGFIRLEFYDTPDDAPGKADGMWVGGELRFQTLFPIPPIPAPAGAGLLLVPIVLILRRDRC